MFASKPILFACLLACFLEQSLSEEIKGKPGENVTLQCHSPRDADIKLLKWSRTDLKSDQGYVYLSRGKRFNEHEQHESFKKRVELMDPEMKNGNVSVILKNVTINDTGTYECYVGNGGSPKLSSTIRLTVTDSGDAAGKTDDKQSDGNNRGHVGLAVGLSVVIVLLLVFGCFGFVIYRKRKGPKEQNSYKAPGETDTNHQ